MMVRGFTLEPNKGLLLFLRCCSAWKFAKVSVPISGRYKYLHLHRNCMKVENLICPSIWSVGIYDIVLVTLSISGWEILYRN